MTAEKLIERLDGVKSRGDSRWIAKCPAHDDKTPSLSVREDSEGKVLVMCFGGCPVYDVITAVGLEFSDLFPPRTETDGKKHPGFNAMDVLKTALMEVRVAALAADALARGDEISGDDLERLRLAAQRLAKALALAKGA